VAEEHNIFLRWARLKQASKESRNASDAATDDEEACAPSTIEPEADKPFDLASLPKIESIGANTDVSAFLSAGVPAELASAALRRAWSSDPAVRDFIGIAENQWDFNDPNGIPGFGPLDPMVRVDDLVAQVSRRLTRIADTLADTTSPIDPPVATDLSQPVIDQRPATDKTLLANIAGKSTQTQDGATPREQEPIEDAHDDPPKRRHGGALPR